MKSAIKSIEDCSLLVESSQNNLTIIKSTQDLDQCIYNGKLGIILHLEGAEPIDAELHVLPKFIEAGLRSLGIVWSRPNIFGTGVPFRFPHTPDTGPGLTEHGKNLVRACNELGVLIDAAHLNEAGFWDLVATSKMPIVSTHTAVHSLCPNSRNLTDRQLDAIKDSDGLIGINFEVSALRIDGKDEVDTPMETLVQHIAYAVDRVGIDRVAFGSDFDGATMSNELAEVSALPKLLHALMSYGYSKDEVAKIAYKNWYRILSQTWI